jgi:two-component system OmpR family response regulator
MKDPIAATQDAHLLIVDDDEEIRKLLARFLRENGYRVTVASDGRRLKETVRDAAIDLVVLDIMLPGTSGFELCRELRASSDTPVIMLTAKGGETDRIVGLELGADDYLAKPFNPRELLARVKAVLRRYQSAAIADKGRRLLFEGWAIDTQRRELRNPAGALVDLSAGEYDLLLTFAEAPQRILSRDHLLDATRNRAAFGFDRTIDVQVSRLRRKLGATNEADGLIKTVRGAGYMFLPSVARE